MHRQRQHYPDISIVTRARLRGLPRRGDRLRCYVNWVCAYGGLSLLHLAGAAIMLANSSSGRPAGLDSLPLDDAWVHLVYARSLIESFSFQFNPGVPEAGMTSPLWVMLVAAAYTALAPLMAGLGLGDALGLAATAKLLGLALAAGTSFVALNLVTKVTGNRTLGFLAGAIIALDPFYSFTKVAGVEAGLFGFLALASVSAFYHGRLILTGLLVGLALAARPEGAILLALVAGSLTLKLLWQRGDLRLVPGEDLPQLLKVAGIPLLAGLLIFAWNFSVNGSGYPNSYLVRHVPLGLFSLENLAALMQGYGRHASYFSNAGAAATLLLLGLAGFRCFQQAKFKAAPLVFFPLGLCYGLAVTIPLDAEPWSIAARRYLDPALPFIAVGLAVGTNVAWRLLNEWAALHRPGGDPGAQALGRRIFSRLNLGFNSARWVSLALTLGFVALVALPYAAMPASWVSMASVYSWNSRNVDDAHRAGAEWVNVHLPEGATVGTVYPGALRFFSRHEVVDLSGLNTHTAIGKPIFDAAQSHDVDYVLAFRNVYFDSWPQGQEVFSLSTPRNTILEGPELVVYRTWWDREIRFADKRAPQSVDTTGFTLLDSFDVGDQGAEEAHFYALTKPGPTVERVFNIGRADGEGINIKDDARTSTGSEEFVVASAAGRPLVVLKRYDAAVAGSVNVYANDVFVGEWILSPRAFVFGEDSFRIAPEQITGATTKLRFEYLYAPGYSLNSFYYWIYTTEY